MPARLELLYQSQQKRNAALLDSCRYLSGDQASAVLPFHIDLSASATLSERQVLQLEAMSIETARTAIRSVASLSKLNEVDHMGGGLDLITALLLTLSVVDGAKKEYTIEHAHTSIGYFSSLATLGFLSPEYVVEAFRRGLDIPGHVSWLPGGTQLNGGRLGVMVPAAVGQALGKKARHGDEALVICHCGDAGWISGQALNGFNAADLHGAPVVFVMHRNGIQLSGSNKSIMNKDPRGIVEAMGVTIVELQSLHDFKELYSAYQTAWGLVRSGKPCMIYPAGLHSDANQIVDLQFYGEKYGILEQVREKAEKNGVGMDRKIWIPGALMSYRDVESMLDCLFLVNELPGGKGHHDGHMKGRDLDQVLGSPMLSMNSEQKKALEELRAQKPLEVVTRARPAPGTANLMLSASALAGVKLPEVGAMASPRNGSEAAYAALAKGHPEALFVIGCDLDPSTKLGKARSFLAPSHQFEMSIEEQASAIMANGLAMSSYDPQLVVFSTFSAFFAGIAREGFEMWRYQRNLNGMNEGLNVTMHLSHVGACTGRDHFSGWDLDWINLALTYLPYLRRFYAPADARSAFLAVRDLAAHYGAHIIGIPRDNLPTLTRQDSDAPLWTADEAWSNLTAYRTYPGAKKAILTIGAPSYLAAEAAEALQRTGTPVDVHIINALPIPSVELATLIQRYPQGIVTVEDGIVSNGTTCLRGLAGVVSEAASDFGIPVDYIGICDPRIAPADGFPELWAHFGITTEAIADAVKRLGA